MLVGKWNYRSLRRRKSFLGGVSEGDVIKLPRGAKHTVRAKSVLKIIEVQIGKEISVGDKEKNNMIS